ncbi:galactose-specific lectin nattectin-like [Labrus bergylta]|uniref:Galactose-specific lectin nattectin-like n=1 Tax=Labrus bergylta TaxID=56723 RepID=A0A3Q3NHX1_9LABR|nr:galactose-specific lectin nattectin-like [Labrus bergylta]
MASGLKLIPLLCLTSGLWAAVVYGNHSGSCKTCPSGWTQFDGSCYMFHFRDMDWADAERYCTTVGGNLASVHNKEEYTFLKTTLQAVAGKQLAVWLGGYDAVKEGVWLWSDGTFFDFKLWFKGEPNNYTGHENCMEMNFRGREYVNDSNCNVKRSFFCEKRL